MKINLIVIHQFSEYKKGDLITNEKEIKSILEGENAHFVVKIQEVKPTKSKE